MPPLRVQARKWERRFVTGDGAGSPSSSSSSSLSDEQQEQQQREEEEQQGLHELRRFTLSGFMPTCRPAGYILPAGVREMCGQAYVELEVAPAIAPDGSPIAWSAAAWPEPAKHRMRLEAWHRKWGDRWAGPRSEIGRGLGPGGGEAALALYFEVPDTNDISEMLMHKMYKAGFSTMLRKAPEMQYKVTKELAARLDVNIPLAQNFVRMLCKRTLEGQILPWLATRQGLMGYILSRSVRCRLPLAAAAACCLLAAACERKRDYQRLNQPLSDVCTVVAWCESLVNRGHRMTAMRCRGLLCVG